MKLLILLPLIIGMTTAIPFTLLEPSEKVVAEVTEDEQQEKGGANWTSNGGGHIVIVDILCSATFFACLVEVIL